MLAVAITLMPQFARMARGQAVSVSVKPYVEAAVTLGLPRGRILLRYVFANRVGPLPVQANLALGAAILQTASLGFLGLGAQPPVAEWGADVSINLDFVRSAPWVALAPGAGISRFALMPLSMVACPAALPMCWTSSKVSAGHARRCFGVPEWFTPVECHATLGCPIADLRAATGSRQATSARVVVC